MCLFFLGLRMSLRGSGWAKWQRFTRCPFAWGTKQVGWVLAERRTGPEMHLTHWGWGVAGPGVQPPALGLPLFSLLSCCWDLMKQGRTGTKTSEESDKRQAKGLQSFLEMPSEGWEFWIRKGSSRSEISVTVVKVTVSSHRLRWFREMYVCMCVCVYVCERECVYMCVRF